MKASLCSLLLIVSIPVVAQTTKKPAPKTAPQQTPQVETSAPAAPQETDAERQQRMADAKADIAKMRAMLDQMDRNMAFAAPGETPLKHQFYLEIDLWRALLDHMEKQVDGEKSAAVSR